MDLQEHVQVDSVKPSPKICTVCTTNKAIYTCPRCAMRTCSLTCCKSHKVTYNCSGRRDVASYVDRQDYNYFSFLSDYRFLESIDRLNDRLARDINEVGNFCVLFTVWIIALSYNLLSFRIVVLLKAVRKCSLES